MTRPMKVNTSKALRARLKGQTYQEIADSQGVHKQNVHKALQPFLKALPHIDQLQEMKATLADHFVATAYRTVASISDEDISKASLQQKATSAGILLDKHRLMTGQTTQNAGLAVFFKAISGSVPGGVVVEADVVDE